MGEDICSKPMLDRGFNVDDVPMMKRKELQALCKKHGIPANLTNREMADRLTMLLKEKDSAITLEKPSLDNSGGMDSQKDSKVPSSKVKKVRFSPENETFVFVRSDPETESDYESCSRKKGATRTRKPRKHIEVTKSPRGEQVLGEALRVSARVTRSTAQKPAEKDELKQLLPGTRRNTRRTAKQVNIEVTKVDESDKPPPELTSVDMVDVTKVVADANRDLGRTCLRSREAPEADALKKLLPGTRKNIRRSAKQVNVEVNDKPPPDLKSVDVVDVTKVGADANRDLRRMRLRSREVVSEERHLGAEGRDLEIPGNLAGRRSKKAKKSSVGMIDRNVEAEGVKSQKQSKRGAVKERTPELETGSEDAKVQEPGKVFQLEKPREGSRRYPLRQRYDAPTKGNGKRSKRNVVVEENTQLLSTQSGKTGAVVERTRSIARLRGKAPRVDNQSDDLSAQEGSVQVLHLAGPAKALGENASTKEDRKRKKSADSEVVSACEGSLGHLQGNVKTSAPLGHLRRSRRNTSGPNSAIYCNGEMGTREAVQKLKKSTVVPSEKRTSIAGSTRRPTRRKSRNSVLISDEVVENVHSVRKDGESQQGKAILKDEGSATDDEPLTEKSSRHSTSKTSKRHAAPRTRLSRGAVERKRLPRGARIQIMAQEKASAKDHFTTGDSSIIDSVQEKEEYDTGLEFSCSNEATETLPKTEQMCGVNSGGQQFTSIEHHVLNSNYEEATCVAEDGNENLGPSEVGAYLETTTSPFSVTVEEKGEVLMRDSEDKVTLHEDVKVDRSDRKSMNRICDCKDVNLDMQQVGFQNELSDLVSCELTSSGDGLPDACPQESTGNSVRLSESEQEMGTQKPLTSGNIPTTPKISDNSTEDKQPIREDRLSDECNRIDKPTVLFSAFDNQPEELNGKESEELNLEVTPRDSSADDPSDGASNQTESFEAAVQEVTPKSHLFRTEAGVQRDTDIQIDATLPIDKSATAHMRQACVNGGDDYVGESSDSPETTSRDKNSVIGTCSNGKKMTPKKIVQQESVESGRASGDYQGNIHYDSEDIPETAAIFLRVSEKGESLSIQETFEGNVQSQDNKENFDDELLDNIGKTPIISKETGALAETSSTAVFASLSPESIRTCLSSCECTIAEENNDHKQDIDGNILDFLTVPCDWNQSLSAFSLELSRGILQEQEFGQSSSVKDRNSEGKGEVLDGNEDLRGSNAKNFAGIKDAQPLVQIFEAQLEDRKECKFPHAAALNNLDGITFADADVPEQPPRETAQAITQRDDNQSVSPDRHSLNLASATNRCASADPEDFGSVDKKAAHMERNGYDLKDSNCNSVSYSEVSDDDSAEQDMTEEEAPDSNYCDCGLISNDCERITVIAKESGSVTIKERVTGDDIEYSTKFVEATIISPQGFKSASGMKEKISAEHRSSTDVAYLMAESHSNSSIVSPRNTFLYCGHGDEAFVFSERDQSAAKGKRWTDENKWNEAKKDQCLEAYCISGHVEDGGKIELLGKHEGHTCIVSGKVMGEFDEKSNEQDHGSAIAHEDVDHENHDNERVQTGNSPSSFHRTEAEDINLAVSCSSDKSKEAEKLATRIIKVKNVRELFRMDLQERGDAEKAFSDIMIEFASANIAASSVSERLGESKREDTRSGAVTEHTSHSDNANSGGFDDDKEATNFALNASTASDDTMSLDDEVAAIGEGGRSIGGMLAYKDDDLATELEGKIEAIPVNISDEICDDLIVELCDRSCHDHSSTIRQVGEGCISRMDGASLENHDDIIMPVEKTATNNPSSNQCDEKNSPNHEFFPCSRVGEADFCLNGVSGCVQGASISLGKDHESFSERDNLMKDKEKEEVTIDTDGRCEENNADVERVNNNQVKESLNTGIAVKSYAGGTWKHKLNDNAIFAYEPIEAVDFESLQEEPVNFTDLDGYSSLKSDAPMNYSCVGEGLTEEALNRSAESVCKTLSLDDRLDVEKPDSGAFEAIKFGGFSDGGEEMKELANTSDDGDQHSENEGSTMDKGGKPVKWTYMGPSDEGTYRENEGSEEQSAAPLTVQDYAIQDIPGNESCPSVVEPCGASQESRQQIDVPLTIEDSDGTKEQSDVPLTIQECSVQEKCENESCFSDLAICGDGERSESLVKEFANANIAASSILEDHLLYDSRREDTASVAVTGQTSHSDNVNSGVFDDGKEATNFAFGGSTASDDTVSLDDKMAACGEDEKGICGIVAYKDDNLATKLGAQTEAIPINVLEEMCHDLIVEMCDYANRDHSQVDEGCESRMEGASLEKHEDIILPVEKTTTSSFPSSNQCDETNSANIEFFPFAHLGGSIFDLSGVADFLQGQDHESFLERDNLTKEAEKGEVVIATDGQREENNADAQNSNMERVNNNQLKEMVLMERIDYAPLESVDIGMTIKGYAEGTWNHKLNKEGISEPPEAADFESLQEGPVYFTDLDGFIPLNSDAAINYSSVGEDKRLTKQALNRTLINGETLTLHDEKSDSGAFDATQVGGFPMDGDKMKEPPNTIDDTDQHREKEVTTMDKAMRPVKWTYVGPSDVGICTDNEGSKEQSSVPLTVQESLGDPCGSSEAALRQQIDAPLTIRESDGTNEQTDVPLTVQERSVQDKCKNESCLSDVAICGDDEGSEDQSDGHMGGSKEPSDASLQTAKETAEINAGDHAASEELNARHCSYDSKSAENHSDSGVELTEVGLRRSPIIRHQAPVTPFKVKSLNIEVKNRKESLIPKTPEYCFKIYDMKENMTSVKGEITGNYTKSKTSIKRRPLEDLRKM